MTKPPAQDLGRVWKQYKSSGDRALRERLVGTYLPLVRYIAERVASKLPRSVEIDDLYQAGVFGLMDAVDGYDLSRDVKFETYCSMRVRGAILDELRAMDWVPRLVRARAHKIDGALRELEAELGRYPTDAEVAARLGVTAEVYEEMLRESTAVSMFPLSKVTHEGEDDEHSHVDILEDTRSPNPATGLQRGELKSRIIASLGEVERLVVVLYYYEELTMKEIGAVLELSESRVCQIHTKIVQRLRQHLRSVQNNVL